jgi:large subunit ribosomal protein L19
VRRAKLYYLRGRTGKSARIAERRDPRPPKGSELAKGSEAAKADAKPAKG